MEDCHVAQLAVDAHLGIEAALLGHVAEAALGSSSGGLPAPEHLTGIGLEYAQRDPHRCGLAGAVGPDESNHLPLRNLEREAIQSNRPAVAP
jgi:hypothetical protein